jgi:predicted nuclease of predicted toxin-antitoxin system
MVEFLADENIDQPIVETLRSKGFDVSAVEEEIKGASDQKVLEKAVEEDRILITFDRDFSKPGKEHNGVIRLTSVAEYSLIVKVINQLSQHFTSQDFQNTVIEASPNDYRS